jgi:hypothetical protein
MVLSFSLSTKVTSSVVATQIYVSVSTEAHDLMKDYISTEITL